LKYIKYNHEGWEKSLEIHWTLSLQVGPAFVSDITYTPFVIGTRTIGVISKIDQASGEPKSLAAVQALLQGQGPRSAADMQWVALIGQSVSLASSQAGSVGSDNSLETAWRAETESLKSILTGVPQNKLGRVALVETLAKQIKNRVKVRLPNVLNGYYSLDDLKYKQSFWMCTFCEFSFVLWNYSLQGKTQMVQDELFRLGEQMVHSVEGTRAIALELCREFEDKFLAHIAHGEVSHLIHYVHLQHNETSHVHACIHLYIECGCVCMLSF
jgi:dynamin 1/3